ncbi:MAG: hypothetical protein HOO06_01295 [Bdellovibrionaceae bacterium]|jgi:hypothetical protein|nr:hypothetical protein [Pseudobdellovibrionaceae bacterium]
MKYLLLFVSFVYTLLSLNVAVADREVSVYPHDGGNSKSIMITNPSTQVMNYDLSCSSFNGGASHAITGNSLASKASNVHSVGEVSSSACSYGSRSNHLNGTKECWVGSATGDWKMYNNIVNACSPGHHACSLDEWQNTKSGLPNEFAFLGNSGTFSTTWDTGGTWNDYGYPNYIPHIYNNAMPAYMCNNGSMGGGAVSSDNCSYTMANSTSAASIMCCSDSGVAQTPVAGAAYCKIKVTGNDGHLISPNFKNGTPF